MPGPDLPLLREAEAGPKPKYGSQTVAMLDDLDRLLVLLKEIEGAHDYDVECVEDAESHVRRMIRRLENDS